MAPMIVELYEALRAAGCDPDLAQAAAEAVYRDCGHGQFPLLDSPRRGPSWLLVILQSLLLLVNALILWWVL